MHKLISLALLVCTLISLSILSADALASGVVISQVQTGNLNGGSKSEELIELYNNSDNDVDVTGWCMNYGNTGSTTPTRSDFVCVNHTEPRAGNYVFLPQRSSVLLISKVYSETYPDFKYDSIFSNLLSDSGRWISLVDKNKVPVDKVEWRASDDTLGISSTAEGGLATSYLGKSQFIQRKMTDVGVFQDSDNNFDDFEILDAPRPLFKPGSLFEVEDLCLNLDYIQITMPADYVLKTETDKQCAPLSIDICPNVDGDQSVVPDGYEKNDSGDCIQVDYCPDLNGVQDINDHCELEILPLKITELLPNAIGTDDGSEFIELFNPNNVDVGLSPYIFYVGSDIDHSYSFPVGSYIKANGYKAFSNKDIKFTLVNTTSSVTLKTTNSLFVDSVPAYLNPGDGMSWSLIDDVWKYTNRPTPDEANLGSLFDDAIEDDTPETLAPCAANQYRNPLTNRCKLLPEYETQLAPCKDGQYRSEETNRCRSIISDVVDLVPCAEGQERNPATNRCRSVAAVLGDSTLTPCKEGQERNPETNRCRNIVAMPDVGYAPEKTAQQSSDNSLYFVLAGVGAVALGYGIWEWRREIAKLLTIIRKRFRRIK